ncbi:MAG: DUF4406 domain-containing protein [Candidatus Aenigmatarchaeota archaeon]
MKKIYICSPFRRNIKHNTKLAKHWAVEIIRQGNLPIAPHLYFPLFLNDDNEYERELGIKFGLKLLKICDEVWVYGEPTEGMKKEIQRAKKLRKKIVYK